MQSVRLTHPLRWRASVPIVVNMHTSNVPILPVSTIGRLAGLTLLQMLHDSLDPAAATIGFSH
jgi:hypothetical protein